MQLLLTPRMGWTNSQRTRASLGSDAGQVPFPTMDSEKYVSIRGEDASNSSKQHTALSELPQRYDRRGLLLDPQPSAHAIDPLNWARWVKLTVLIEVSTLSFLVLFSASLIVRALQPFWPEWPCSGRCH